MYQSFAKYYDLIHSDLTEDIDFRGETPVYEQLFDLNRDPGEKRNVIDDIKNSDVLERLRKQCTDCSSDIMEHRREYYRLMHKN